MAKSKLDPIQRRNLLWGPKSTPESLKAAGREHLAAGADYEALQFFVRSQDVDGFRSLLARAVERGDSFLLAQVDQAHPGIVTAEHYSETAGRAESLEKYRYAVWGYEKAGDEAARKRVEEKLIGAQESSDAG
jgi:hypothetical protein